MTNWHWHHYPPKKYTVLIKIVWNQVIIFPSYHNIKSFSIKGIKQMFVMNLCFQFLAVPRIQLKENVTKLISASVRSENGRGLHWQLFRHFIQTYKRSPIYAIVTVQYLIHYIYIYIICLSFHHFFLVKWTIPHFTKVALSPWPPS